MSHTMHAQLVMACDMQWRNVCACVRTDFNLGNSAACSDGA